MELVGGEGGAVAPMFLLGAVVVLACRLQYREENSTEGQ